MSEITISPLEMLAAGGESMNIREEVQDGVLPPRAMEDAVFCRRHLGQAFGALDYITQSGKPLPVAARVRADSAKFHIARACDEMDLIPGLLEAMNRPPRRIE